MVAALADHADALLRNAKRERRTAVRAFQLLAAWPGLTDLGPRGQLAEVERLERDLPPDVEHGGLAAVAVVDGGEPALLALAIGGQRRLAGSHRVGKLAAPGDDVRLLHVAHREAAEPLEEEALPGLDSPWYRTR